MNIYKLFIFDGYMAKIILVNGCDMVGAIQCSGFISSQVFKVELVGSSEQPEDRTMGEQAT